MQRLDWDEQEDIDDVESVDSDNPIVEMPDEEFRYMWPISLGDTAIESVADFLAHVDELRDLYLECNPYDQAICNWDDIYLRMTSIHDEELMDSAALELMISLLTAPVGAITVTVEPLSRWDEIMGHIESESQALLNQAIRDLTLDSFNDTGQRVSISREDADVRGPVPVVNRSDAVPPPLSPESPFSFPIALRLAAKYSKLDLDLRTEWLDIFKQDLEGFDFGLFDLIDDKTVASTARSNTRPSLSPSVYFIYSDGTQINIGSHGYALRANVDIPLDFSDIQCALSELFSAPGGEGLTCATPSHLLHQMSSAVLAHAMDPHLLASTGQHVLIEHENIDISSTFMPDGRNQLAIDVTTSAGIYNKKLRSDGQNPGFRVQAAISKYDVLGALRNACSDQVRELFLKACGNALACEYPYYYRQQVKDIDSDLQIQSEIFSVLSRMPKKTLVDLSELCYKAATEESLTLGLKTDIYATGKPWKDKRDILLKAASGLQCRSSIAFPPIPISEIKPLPSDRFSIVVGGHTFTTGPYTVQGSSSGPMYHMGEVETFLQRFPASGIISEADAYELAGELDENPMATSGHTHQGPLHSYDPINPLIRDAACKIYARSSYAQLAEVRSDVARAVYKNPMPGPGCWSQTFVYKGKVSVWYRCRDNPTSPEGYRIDWFAVSAFEVAGSISTTAVDGSNLFLWPRQRLRSQELRHVHMAPRRLSLVLISMIEKSKSAQLSTNDLYLAWERLAATAVSSTYASGKLFITCRYLSTTLGAPASPFHEMASKLEDPRNYCDIIYITRLKKTLSQWVSRDQYAAWSPMLGVPRAFSQLESYWMIWIPNEYADTNKSMALCVMGLYDEAKAIEMTMQIRCDDLHMQLALAGQRHIGLHDLQDSLKRSCSLDTGGKLGWSWVGSLASGYALDLRSKAASFDRRYARGHRARNLCDHLTVRHSARIDENNVVHKGTVAEMMIEMGFDDFLSTISQCFRFLYGKRPVFFNHPKNGELKEREISITDPDSRVLLSDAELICGKYGVTTKIDFLKDPSKNAKFYKTSSRVMSKGGGIQSSDATRYGPYMSNFAIAVMLLYLGTQSMHLRWAAIVYARLAFRQMLITEDVIPTLDKYTSFPDTGRRAVKTLEWIRKMPIHCTEDGVPQRRYCTSHHMGQGMSHHSSSLLHAGGLAVAVDSVLKSKICLAGRQATFQVHIMVTSDDSTLMVEPQEFDDDFRFSRQQKQILSRVFLQMIRNARNVALRMVSVKANLVKEMISGVKGEFNSQDTGIGSTCPILGFRELISLTVEPSSASLVGDYMNAHACARDISFAGQGLVVGAAAHHILIDAIEERWSLDGYSKDFLRNTECLPKPLIEGCAPSELCSSPASWLHPHARANLLRLNIDKNLDVEDLDPHCRDSIFAPLMHVRIDMPFQHRKALACINSLKKKLELKGMHNQVQMIDMTLRSTLASAKSRNLGRVAMRVRHRIVTPKPFLKHTFEKGGLLETSLNWIKTVDHEYVRKTASYDDIHAAAKLAGYVKLVPRQRFGFPRPPEVRRFLPQRIVKPVYMEKYGKTPFGRHAITRSGVVVVDHIGQSERETMQSYLAAIRHRRFSEHMEYGGSFVDSWFDMTSTKIVGLDIADNVAAAFLEHVRWGSFSQEAIRKLKDLADQYPSNIIMALHRYDGTVGLWHCIHKNQPISVHINIDIDAHDSDGILHQLPSGEYAILALQGFQGTNDFTNVAPNAQEVQAYQHADYETFMPRICRNIEDTLMRSSHVDAATYSTVVNDGTSDHLVYVSPVIKTTPSVNPALKRRLPYLRAKVIADLALSGYWETNLPGTAFRAFIKNHYSNETIWTGGVLGWRSSNTGIPIYYNTTQNTIFVEKVVILDGIDREDMLTSYNVHFTSSGIKVLSQSSTTTFTTSTQLETQYIDLIVAANKGERFHVKSGHCMFLNFDHEPVSRQPAMAREDAIAQLVALINGKHPDQNVDDAF